MSHSASARTDVVDARLDTVLDDDARTLLQEQVAEVCADPRRIAVRFPAAGRTVARGPLDQDDPQGLLGPTIEDLVRRALLTAFVRGVGADTERVRTEVAALYRYGDADEKRAVLRSLHLLPLEDAGLPLVRDALRTNDLRLVAAALGRYAADHLDVAAWRHGVLKCLFVGVPLAAVDRLSDRADAELVRMVTAFAEERRAAGRDVPADAALVLHEAGAELQSTREDQGSS